MNKIKINFRLAVFVVVFSIFSVSAYAEIIINTNYDKPVDRYGHFALGRPYEYSRVVVTTDTGGEYSYSLPVNEVFEDLSPRIVKLAVDTPKEILTIVSEQETGSRLVLFQLKDDRLEISAQSRAIGTPMRWLNPVGVADLDGDGRAEIAAVITPHIGGALKVYRKQGKTLLEVASLEGFSNHVYRTSELALSTVILVDGKMRLLVPDATRTSLRLVGLQNGSLVETDRCQLLEPVTGPITRLSPSEVSLGLLSGLKVNVPGDCPGQKN